MDVRVKSWNEGDKRINTIFCPSGNAYQFVENYYLRIDNERDIEFLKGRGIYEFKSLVQEIADDVLNTVQETTESVVEEVKKRTQKKKK